MSPEKNLKLMGVKEAFNSKPLRWMSKKRLTSFSLDTQRKPELLSEDYPPSSLFYVFLKDRVGKFP
jgi:hypothetical protein